VLIPEKIHLPDRGSVPGVFQEDAQKNNGAEIQGNDSHRPDPQNSEVVRIVMQKPGGREGRQHITRGARVNHQWKLAHVFQSVHFMQSLGGSRTGHLARVWHAFRFVPVHRCKSGGQSAAMKSEGTVPLFCHLKRIAACSRLSAAETPVTQRSHPSVPARGIDFLAACRVWEAGFRGMTLRIHSEGLTLPRDHDFRHPCRCALESKTSRHRAVLARMR
jgi:hypothetical protein